MKRVGTLLTRAFIAALLVLAFTAHAAYADGQQPEDPGTSLDTQPQDPGVGE
jgi:hypothetical protein